MVTLTPHTTRATGTVLTAAIYNSDHENHYTNYAAILAALEGLSGTNAQSYRNVVINGGFDVWQRATSQTTSAMDSADRWWNTHVGTTVTTSRVAFTVGQTSVPGNPVYALQAAVTSVAGASNFARCWQSIEGVTRLSGGTATLTFWAKAASGCDMAVELQQYFGSSGSAQVNGIGSQKVTLTSAWQKFSLAISIPSVSGKTITTGEDYLIVGFWFDAGSDYDSRTDTLGQQSNTFTIARVSLVEDDVTDQDDPFWARPLDIETFLCRRYFQFVTISAKMRSTGAAYTYAWPVTFQEMRVAPTATSEAYTSLTNITGTPTAGDIVNNSLLYSVVATASGDVYARKHIFSLDAEL